MPENASIKIELIGASQVAADAGASRRRAGERPEAGMTPVPITDSMAKPSPDRDEPVSVEAFDVEAELMELPRGERGVRPADTRGIGPVGGMLGRVLPGVSAAAMATIGGVTAGIGAVVYATKKLVDNANEVADRLTPYAPEAARERGLQEAATVMATVDAARQYEGELARWEAIKGLYGRGWNETKNAGMTYAAAIVPESPMDLVGLAGNLPGLAAAKATREAAGLTGWETTDAVMGAIGEVAPGIERIYERIKGEADSDDLFTWYQDVKTPDPPAWVLSSSVEWGQFAQGAADGMGVPGPVTDFLDGLGLW